MNEKSDKQQEITGAEALLRALKFHGIDYLFANAGTDFPTIIEELAKIPEDEICVPLTIPHETATVGMAHGYYLVTGRPQAVMVHVNVGLANAVMGVINAASDNVPVLVMSGRTPITEHGRTGRRMTPIQYGQEMFDQSSLVADVVKYHYEMRYPEQAGPLVARALAASRSAPEGPSYLSLPREALAETFPPGRIPAETERPPATLAHPDPYAVARAAEILKNAKNPLILVQRSDPEGRLSTALQTLADRHAIAVAEPFVVRNVMPSSHPMFLGHDVGAALTRADVVVALDCDIPWIEAQHRPADDVRLIHAGPDPHFLRMPVRGYRTDLAIQSDPAAFILALGNAMQEHPCDETRKAELDDQSRTRRAAALAKAEEGRKAPMSAEWLSKCLSDAIDDQAVVFSELGALPGAMNISGPNRFFSNPHSGGLGWAMPAALGAQLADRERLCVAVVGDGTYIFANPVACHQISEALDLPTLTIIKNNGLWNAVRRSVVNAYPDGAAARSNKMPLTSLEPAPDYLKIAQASRAHTERVEHGTDLPAALARAIRAIREERRQAVIEVCVEVSDKY
ncbi:MAG: thiamine pyrophosphate-requiring protein [Paracoccaceae bacterium]|nr:thiamine pyrophosphate-requiring protein [Paracoccaceae bacterium]